MAVELFMRPAFFLLFSNLRMARRRKRGSGDLEFIELGLKLLAIPVLYYIVFKPKTGGLNLQSISPALVAIGIAGVAALLFVLFRFLAARGP